MNVKRSTDVLDSFRFIAHPEKLVSAPSKYMKHPDFMINFENMTTFLTDGKE